MARSYGFSRRRGGPPVKLVAILGGVVLVGLIAAVFWFSSQAESRKPAPIEIRVEATNVGAH